MCDCACSVICDHLFYLFLLLVTDGRISRPHINRCVSRVDLRPHAHSKAGLIIPHKFIYQCCMVTDESTPLFGSSALGVFVHASIVNSIPLACPMQLPCRHFAP